MLLAVVRHFGDFQEDQFDFHSYCVRKMTLRAYVAMLRMEDTLHSNIFYSKVRTPRVVTLVHLKLLYAARDGSSASCKSGVMCNHLASSR